MVNIRHALARLVGGPAFASQPGNPLDDRYYQSAGGFSISPAGVPVTAQTALGGASTVYRCVSILANTLAMLPMDVIRKMGSTRTELADHPVALLFRKVNTWQTAMEFLRLQMTFLLLRSNAYTQIVWQGSDPVQLIPLHPDRVSNPEMTSEGVLRYWYTPPKGEKVALIGGFDLMHIRGLSLDGLKGLSIVDAAKTTLGLAIAAEQHAARFFGQSAQPSGVLSHKGTLKPETAERIRESWQRQHGGLQGAHKVAVLWEGMTWTATQMSNVDAQLLESRKFTVAEICRWFGVPNFMVFDVEKSTSWGTGIEEQGLAFLVYSLQPWITLWEQALEMHLLVQEPDVRIKFNAKAILRVDAKTAAEIGEIEIRCGVRNPNEVRELLDLNPREGGDAYADPRNLNGPTAPSGPPPPKKPKAPPPPPPGNDASVRWAAGEMLALEREALLAASQKHAGSQEMWRRSVGAFYVRHVALVAEALGLSQDKARAYCEEQKAIVLMAGPGVAESLEVERAPRLVALALGEGQ